jgi:hypothetical protein
MPGKDFEAFFVLEKNPLFENTQSKESVFTRKKHGIASI